MIDLPHPELRAWAAMGTRLRVGGEHLAPQEVFVLDAPARSEDPLEPLVVVHGFPTSSYDWSHLLDRLTLRRRVVLVDLPGFGLSDKPDVHYTIAMHADAIAAVLSTLGLSRFALLSHDMGDTVAGELLARQSEGTWQVGITRRVVTNGSIYISMAHLTDGQLMLLSLPDERAEHGPGPELLSASLTATLSPDHDGPSMDRHAELVCHLDGDRLLPRTIRYIEERRANEARFTGAIESHPSPLHVVWGPDDPIALASMAERLRTARPDATLQWVGGAGHYPQIEDPDAYVAALDAVLG